MKQTEDSHELPVSGLTYYQEKLIDEAKDMWERGFRIPVNLYATMAQEGLDVQTLEETYYKDEA